MSELFQQLRGRQALFEAPLRELKTQDGQLFELGKPAESEAEIGEGEVAASPMNCSLRDGLGRRGRERLAVGDRE